MPLPSAVRHALAVLALSRVAQSFATPGTPACSVATSCGASAVSMALRGGMEMPPIMYGTAWKKERTAELVVQAVREGFRGIDTACQPKHYFEPGVGAALRTLEQEGIPRSSIFLQTKYTPIRGQDPNKVPYDRAQPVAKQVEQSVQVSLKNLNTSYIDSVVLHSPLPTHEDNMAAWRVLESLHKQGVIGRLGVSNCYDLSVLQAIAHDAEVKPSVVQNRWYKDSDYDKALRAWCRERGIAYQSFWTLTGNPQLLSSKPVRASAQRLSKTPEQILFAFVAHLGITPLTGTTSVQHMRQDLEVFGGGMGAPLELHEQELSAIASLL